MKAKFEALGREPNVTRLASSFPPFENALRAEGLESILDALQLHFNGGIEWQVTEKWVLGPRVVGDSMFFLFYNGHGKAGVEDDHFDVQAGDLMLIPKGREHFVRQGPGVEFHLSAVHFDANVFGGVNVLELLGFPHHFRLDRKRDRVIFRGVSAMNRETALKVPGYQNVGAAWMLQILFHLMRNFGTSFRPPYRTGHLAELRRMLPAFEYIERNLSDGGISVGEMAKRVFISEVQFRKIFRRVTGMSPVRFVQSRRVERACRMLRQTDLSVEQIATETGFNDTPFFCRVFKQRTRLTPAQYRLGTV